MDAKSEVIKIEGLQDPGPEFWNWLQDKLHNVIMWEVKNWIDCFPTSLKGWAEGRVQGAISAWNGVMLYSPYLSFEQQSKIRDEYYALIGRFD